MKHLKLYITEHKNNNINKILDNFTTWLYTEGIVKNNITAEDININNVDQKRHTITFGHNIYFYFFNGNTDTELDKTKADASLKIENIARDAGYKWHSDMVHSFAENAVNHNTDISNDEYANAEMKIWSNIYLESCEGNPYSFYKINKINNVDFDIIDQINYYNK